MEDARHWIGLLKYNPSTLYLFSSHSREFEVMFSEADKNDDGKIDFDEFVAMMLPATMLSP